MQIKRYFHCLRIIYKFSFNISVYKHYNKTVMLESIKKDAEIIMSNDFNIFELFTNSYLLYYYADKFPTRYLGYLSRLLSPEFVVVCFI
uniref:Uncharacterized protein n=1 Tax=Heterorhabditis bacteriophora TaxID=37862 RepID=A0A1I7WZ76_HETBA